jgi:hypothetical protein
MTQGTVIVRLRSLRALQTSTDGEDGNHTRELEYGKCSSASLIVLWKLPQQVAWI